MNLTFTKEDFEQFILKQDPEREVDNSYVYSDVGDLLSGWANCIVGDFAKTLPHVQSLDYFNAVANRLGELYESDGHADEEEDNFDLYSALNQSYFNTYGEAQRWI